MAKVTSRWAHGDEITGVAYTPDGSYVVTSSEEFTMHVFPQKGDSTDSSAIKIETQEPVTCLVVTKDSIFTGSSDCMVRQYGVENKDFMGIIIRCDLKVRCLAISPDRKLLAVGSESPDIKIINLEDPEKCWAFRGHKKAVNSLSFDPLGEFLLSSSCDGTVIVWNLKSSDTKPVEIINVIPPTTIDSTTRIPVAWHPSNEFFVIGKDKDIAAHHRLTWKKSFTYRTGSSNPVRCLAWSPNGKFLAASSTDAELWVWQYKEKENPMLTHKHNNGGITAVAWTPNANRLVFTDTVGELSRWDDVVNPEKGSPFNQPKPDPLEGLFDEAAVEDPTIEDQGLFKDMAQEYMSDNESLNDFIVEDETGTYLEKRPSSSQKPGAQTRPAKELHPRFHSGSTSLRDERQYLAFNLLGVITSVNHGTHATVSVEFHDKLAHRGYHFTDNAHFTMACIGIMGTLFAAESKDDNPSTVFYKTYDSWATKSEWQIYLPEGEDATAIALNAESAVVATSRGYVRVFSLSGVQTALFSVGSVISAAGKDDMILLIHHQGEPFEGFSEGGIPTFYDDKGMLYILNYYRRVDQGQWTPILDTAWISADSESRPHYWPIGLTDEALTCVKCRKGETEPPFPKPSVTELPLRLPTLYQDTVTGKHEEAWLRQKILSGLNKDEKMATSFERADNVVAKKELEMDKLALQMIDLACKADRTQKALDLTAMLCNLKSIDAAVKIAHHHNLHSLMERMNKVKEIKIMQEQDKDPNAEMELIMANPVLAERNARDQGTYKVSSRDEDQELERRTFQRTAPIKANDPFGRRVVKESTMNKAANGRGSTSANAGASGANPFKKKSGSDSAGAPKGFGAVVRESDKTILPLTRRATDLFEATDLLIADERRAKAEKEQARQDEVLRKRKANNAAPNGGQKTLSMFAKPAGGDASSSSSAEAAKRFKKQQDEEQDIDMAMDADDFLEDIQGDEEEDEDLELAASVVIPATQDEEDILESSIEETRGHLEKTRVASSLSPSKSSSSVLAGFKFNAS
ncbi:hypothetical protein BGZ58_001792 [Dissophora ornata]|nr:hypothetical protein BGZ58_001792 [Dissophora ornata]